MNDETLVELTDEQQSDLDNLQKRIDDLEAQLEKQFNMWTAALLSQLKKQAATWYEENGKVKNELPPELTPSVQFSPEEVLNVEGWQVIHPPIPTPLPKFLLKGDSDPSEGLMVSMRRSNGCFQIKNLQLTGLLWRDHAKEVAEHYGCSERLIRMAGYSMVDQWFMLPTEWMPGGNHVADYSFVPEVVDFNDEEKRVWHSMFIRHHFSGGALVGASMQKIPLLVYPNVLGGDWKDADGNKIVGQPVGARHYMITYANHPEYIIPALMEDWNTTKLRTGAYKRAFNTAHNIDMGRMVRVNGYKSPQELGVTLKEMRNEIEPRTKSRLLLGKGFEL